MVEFGAPPSLSTRRPFGNHDVADRAERPSGIVRQRVRIDGRLADARKTSASWRKSNREHRPSTFRAAPISDPDGLLREATIDAAMQRPGPPGRSGELCVGRRAARLPSNAEGADVHAVALEALRPSGGQRTSDEDSRTSGTSCPCVARLADRGRRCGQPVFCDRPPPRGGCRRDLHAVVGHLGGFVDRRDDVVAAGGRPPSRAR